MKFTPEFLEVYFPLLTMWNSIMAPVALILIFNDRFVGWPALARFGFATSCVGLIADAVMLSLGVDTGVTPYWSLKDIGLGLITISFALKFFLPSDNRQEG